MRINSDHLIGLAAGITASAACFYLYKRNQSQFDTWLAEHGIKLTEPLGHDPEKMTLEELVVEKERLEDIIAEREMAQSEEASEKPE